MHQAGPPISLDELRAAIPEGGLFQGKTWRFGPEPFPLAAEDVALIRELGPALLEFLKAINSLYYTTETKLKYVREILDTGKPEWLIALHDSMPIREIYPQLLRPDLLLTPGGLKMTEIDSIPGGIGVMDFLNKQYREKGFKVIAGSNSIGKFFVDSNIRFVFSEEACAYRPEIEWMLRNATGTNSQHTFLETDLTEDALKNLQNREIYRYFELWDDELSPSARKLLDMCAKGEVLLTPPPKAFFEEKLLLAFYWDPFLRSYWQGALSAKAKEILDQVIPFGWVMTTRKLPPHAVFPKLEVWNLKEIKSFSQKDRRLALKISGFSKQAWGSRGVYIGHDLSTAEWSKQVDRALDSFDSNPYILQEFQPSRIVTNRYFTESGATIDEKGVVRLSPYYLIANNSVELNGVLAVVCPPDKKKIHGMNDATFLPCQEMP